MPTSLSRIVSLIQSGSALQLQEALAAGFEWPKEPARHPVFDLLDTARLTNALEAPQKLEALIAHGMPVDFALPFGANVPPSRKEMVQLGLIHHPKAKNKHLDASLLERAAGLGLASMVDALLRHGAKDASGVARKMAAVGGKLPVLERILNATPSEDFQWKEWAPTLLERRDIDAKALDFITRYLPPPENDHEVAAVLRKLSDQRFRRGILKWLDHMPTLWGRLHDTPCPPNKTGVVPSLWPHVLCPRARETHPHLFHQAVAHLQRQPAWKSVPVAALHAPQWGPRNIEDDFIKSGLMGWTSQKILLPPLQALLHGSRRLPRGSGELRRMVRSARTMMAHGCELWVDGGEIGKPHTEQTLWAAADLRPSKRWLQRNEVFLAPHAETGDTPLHWVITTAGADHWIECGLDIGATDAHGNQALARIVPLAARTPSHPMASVSKSQEWTAWLIEGWKKRSFPTHGRAWNAGIAELACCQAAVFSALPASVRKSMPKNGQGLHWAAKYGNTKVIEKLLAMGHDDSAVDHEGLTPLACLAMGTAAGWNQVEEKGFSRCLDIAIAGQWPEGVAADGKTPFQRLMSTAYGKEAVGGGRSGTSIDRLLRHLLQRRIDQPEQWSAGDTTAVIEAMLDKSNPLVFSRFVRPLPAEALDDLLLALHDPARWPKTGNNNDHSFFGKMVVELVKLGANYEATSLTGDRLVDGWSRLETWESSISELRDEQRDTLLSQGEARSVMEHQRLQRTDVTDRDPPQERRRPRL